MEQDLATAIGIESSSELLSKAIKVVVAALLGFPSLGAEWSLRYQLGFW